MGLKITTLRPPVRAHTAQPASKPPAQLGGRGGCAQPIKQSRLTAPDNPVSFELHLTTHLTLPSGHAQRKTLNSLRVRGHVTELYIGCSGTREWGPSVHLFRTEPRCSDDIQPHSGTHSHRYYFSEDGLGYSPTRHTISLWKEDMRIDS